MNPIAYPLSLYIVHDGETLADIAEKNHMTVADLLTLNPNLKMKKVHFGMPLNVYSETHLRVTPPQKEQTIDWRELRDLFVYYSFFPNYCGKLLRKWMEKVKKYLQNAAIYSEKIEENIYQITTYLCQIVESMQKNDLSSIPEKKESIKQTMLSLLQNIQAIREDFPSDCLIALRKLPHLILQFLLALWNDNLPQCEKKEEEILQELSYFR